MNPTIKTRRYGEKTFWATQRPGGSYVYLEGGPQRTGAFGQQITEKGEATLWCDGTQAGLDKVARKWWAAQLRDIRKYGM